MATGHSEIRAARSRPSAVVGAATWLDGRYDDQSGLLVEADECPPVPDAQTPLVSSTLEASHITGGQSLDRGTDALLFVAR